MLKITVKVNFSTPAGYSKTHNVILQFESEFSGETVQAGARDAVVAALKDYNGWARKLNEKANEQE